MKDADDELAGVERERCSGGVSGVPEERSARVSSPGPRPRGDTVGPKRGDHTWGIVAKSIHRGQAVAHMTYRLADPGRGPDRTVCAPDGRDDGHRDGDRIGHRSGQFDKREVEGRGEAEVRDRSEAWIEALNLRVTQGHGGRLRKDPTARRVDGLLVGATSDPDARRSAGHEMCDAVGRRQDQTARDQRSGAGRGEVGVPPLIHDDDGVVAAPAERPRGAGRIARGRTVRDRRERAIRRNDGGDRLLRRGGVSARGRAHQHEQADQDVTEIRGGHVFVSEVGDVLCTKSTCA